jgi:hypothetical protein
MSIVASQSGALTPSSITTAKVPVSPSSGEPIENGRNLEWPKAKPWLESRLQVVLDTSGKTPEKERNQAWNDIQTWKMVGPVNGRAENEADVNAFFEKFGQSDLTAKMSYLGNIQALTLDAAGVAGQNTGTAAINWAKELSPEDREFFFMGTPDKNGRYEFKGFDDYLSLMSRYEKEWKPPPTGGEGPPLSRDEQVAIARLEAINASRRDQLDKLKAEYSNRFGTKRTVTDTIELSGPAAKLAAKNSASDGANDVALKALQNLKEVAERQRERAKNLVEEDADGSTKILDQTTDHNDGEGTPQAPAVSKPGSVVSIAA